MAQNKRRGRRRVAENKAPQRKPMKKRVVESQDKFQQMLEFLVNEDRAKAEELFHEIVVEKSRSIYEGLLEDEEEEVDESDDEEVDESDDEEVEEGYYAEADDEEDEEDSQEESMYSESDDEEVDEADEDDVEENYYDEAEDDLEMGGDPEGDLSMDMGDEEGDMGDDEMDMGDDEMDMDAGEEGADDDRIADLEAELADLKAEFEDMMAGEEGGDDMDDMGDEEGADDMDMGSDEGGDDMDMGDEEPEEEAFQYESKSNQRKSAAEQMREYVEKISGPNFPGPGKMGDNGAYTKSPVASKNDMGGTTANILNGGTSSETNVVGKGGTVQGNGHLNQTPKDMNTGNINVPGGKAGKNTWKNNSAGHGAERKGKPESADKGAGSPLNGAPKRAK